MTALPIAPPGRTILLLESDPDLRQQHALYLGMAGFRVLEARHSGEGIRLARRFVPQIALAEFSESMAHELSAALNPDPLSPVTPVIALVDACDQRILEHAAEAGFESLLPTGCGLLDLLHEVQSVLAACQTWHSYSAVVRERARTARSRGEAPLERSRLLREKFEYLRVKSPGLDSW